MPKSLLTILISLLFTVSAFAQITTGIVLLTPQEKQQLQTAKQMAKKFKKTYKAYSSDSGKLSRDIKKKYKTEGEAVINEKIQLANDSLREAYNLDQYIEEMEPRLGRLRKSFGGRRF
ncbi:MAG: hypothetical protein OEW75_17030 [Cyclobacteriaceae bacterium]|nr:hypothetical protein [Cyclobacteriaceae bacterium]